MSPETGRPTDWESATAVLRRRGYLGGEDGGSRRPGTGVRAAGWFLVLAVMLASGVAVAGIAPAGGFAVAWTVLLVSPVLLLALGLVTAVLARFFEWRHRAGLDAGRASLGAGIGVAVTAGFLWLVLTAEAPVPRWGVQQLTGALLALAAAAGLARLAGHRLAARLLRRSPDLEVRVPRPVRAVGAAAVVVVLGLALVSGDRPGPAPEGEPLRVRPHHGRLAILAVDGLPLGDLRLVASEEGSAIARWHGVPLDARCAGDTLPVAWVTVATGVRPEVHGVISVRQLRFPGPGGDVLAAPLLRRLLLSWRWSGAVVQRSVPAARRRVPAVWEMASHAGMGVLVAGWWGSFPPRRVSGLEASVRWVLTGQADATSVFPPEAVDRLPDIPGSEPLAMDRRAAALALEARPGSTDLVVAYLPGWWLERRSAAGGPLAVARTLRPHVELLVETAERLTAAGWSVWIVSLDGSGGGWVLSSRAGDGREPVAAEALLPTWLDELGLPVPPGSAPPRRDLSGVTAKERPPVASYGPPPPLVGAPRRGEGAAQLELIETLGYLR